MAKSNHDKPKNGLIDSIIKVLTHIQKHPKELQSHATYHQRAKLYADFTNRRPPIVPLDNRLLLSWWQAERYNPRASVTTRDITPPDYGSRGFGKTTTMKSIIDDIVESMNPKAPEGWVRLTVEETQPIADRLKEAYGKVGYELIHVADLGLTRLYGGGKDNSGIYAIPKNEPTGPKGDFYSDGTTVRWSLAHNWERCVKICPAYAHDATTQCIQALGNKIPLLTTDGTRWLNKAEYQAIAFQVLHWRGELELMYEAAVAKHRADANKPPEVTMSGLDRALTELAEEEKGTEAGKAFEGILHGTASIEAGADLKPGGWVAMGQGGKAVEYPEGWPNFMRAVRNSAPVEDPINFAEAAIPQESPVEYKTEFGSIPFERWRPRTPILGKGREYQFGIDGVVVDSHKDEDGKTIIDKIELHAASMDTPGRVNAAVIHSVAQPNTELGPEWHVADKTKPDLIIADDIENDDRVKLRDDGQVEIRIGENGEQAVHAALIHSLHVKEPDPSLVVRNIGPLTDSQSDSILQPAEPIDQFAGLRYAHEGVARKEGGVLECRSCRIVHPCPTAKLVIAYDALLEEKKNANGEAVATDR